MRIGHGTMVAHTLISSLDAERPLDKIATSLVCKYILLIFATAIADCFVAADAIVVCLFASACVVRNYY